MLVLIAVALAPVFAIVWYIYQKDKYEKEPAALLLKSFFLGILSIIPALIGSAIGGSFFEVSANPIITAIYAFGVIALSEEFAKFIFLRFVMFPKKEFDEPIDGIVYGVMIGMGFAAFENVLYVIEGGLSTAILRMFTAVPAHAVFGVAMGYYVGMDKFTNTSATRLSLIGLFIAILLHGAYDFFLLQTNIPALTLVSFVGLALAIRWSKKAIKTHQNLSPFKQN